MATRADVALRAGVSPSTVTYVLTGKRSIGEATKKRVMAAIKELDYQPNHAAMALAGGTNKMIALLAPAGKSGLSPSFVEYINGVSQAARVRGWHLMVYSENDVTIEDILNFYKSGLLDGVLLMEIQMKDDRIDFLRKHAVPHVAIGRTADTSDLIFVDRDFERDGRAALDYLVQLGHTSLALVRVGDPEVETHVGADVRFSEVIRNRAKEKRVKLLEIVTQNTAHNGREAFFKIRAKSPDVTAIITLGDLLTLALLNAARESGMNIPDDVSVLALAVPEVSIEMSWPPLSSLTVNDEELGFEAGNLLIRTILKEPITQSQRLWSGELHARGTTAPKK